MIAQKELKELLHYDPEVGIFTWKVSLNRKIRIGSIAGTKNKYWGYIYVCINQKKYRAHRLAWFYVYGVWPEQIDHINHIRDDNRLNNLRITTQSENLKNATLRKNNTSGIAGVSICGKTGKHVVKIWIDKKETWLGYFVDFFEACCVRKSAENKYGYHSNHGGKKSA